MVSKEMGTKGPVYRRVGSIMSNIHSCYYPDRKMKERLIQSVDQEEV